MSEIKKRPTGGNRQGVKKAVSGVDTMTTS